MSNFIAGSVSNSIKCAVVGYGQAATLLHAALCSQPGVEFQWVIGHQLHGAAEFASKYGIPNSSSNFADLLNDETVDVVAICTPHELHYPQALASLQAGKHTIVEVPMTLDYEEAQSLVQLSKEKNLLLSVPHITRYVTSAIHAKRLIEEGKLGRVFQIIYRRLWLQREVGHVLNRKRSWIDSVSWHHAAHAVDLASWLLEEPLDCVGAIVGRHPDHGNPVDLSANFTTPSGTIVTLTLSYNSPSNIFDCVVVGEQALLEMKGFTHLDCNGTAISAEPKPLVSQQEAYKRYAKALVAALRGDADVPISGADILPTMIQLQKIHDFDRRN